MTRRNPENDLTAQEVAQLLNITLRHVWRIRHKFKSYKVLGCRYFTRESVYVIFRDGESCH